MDFKVTLQIWNAKSKEEAEEAVNALQDASDLDGRKAEDNPGDEIQINWMAGDDGDVKPL